MPKETISDKLSVRIGSDMHTPSTRPKRYADRTLRDRTSFPHPELVRSQNYLSRQLTEANALGASFAKAISPQQFFHFLCPKVHALWNEEAFIVLLRGLLL
ncbi:hypothetical protein [Microseira wollei]|uniref:Transposase n=1 Tax=Microseira wollei NIES-4236 TaxID=2530354 RepID=A0AAV3XI10_9CYAN|nr:hypothetical protein [Microseira wollei]GET40361.1 hypothetical protein MiSe_51700 [Microseira wollei NIES-4236]